MNVEKYDKTKKKGKKGRQYNLEGKKK